MAVNTFNALQQLVHGLELSVGPPLQPKLPTSLLEQSEPNVKPLCCATDGQMIHLLQIFQSDGGGSFLLIPASALIIYKACFGSCAFSYEAGMYKKTAAACAK